MSENQERVLKQIEDVAAWLNSARDAIEQSDPHAFISNPDAIIRYACKEGARRLRDILENMGD